MVTLNKILQAEEEFRRYHNRLWRELDEADMHFSVFKYISNASAEYLQELNQAHGFWDLTMKAHILSTIMHLNNLFGKEAKEKHLHMSSFLDFVKENLDIFSREAFERRLRTAGKYDELAEKFNPQITAEKVDQDIKRLSNLPISGLKAWRGRILSHIDKNDIAQNVNITKKYPVKTKHISEIIEMLDKMLNEYTLSIVIRNLRLNASIMKPSTTLTELSQPPDLGSLRITEGNNANIVNGMANASPNPSIPTVGLSTSPVAASTSSTPIMGPVQLKDTITVVRPMKNEESIPPLSALESAPLTQLFGRTISNAPKKDTAKMTKSRKNIVFGIQWVLRVFANPAPALERETMMPRDA